MARGVHWMTLSSSALAHFVRAASDHCSKERIMNPLIIEGARLVAAAALTSAKGMPLKALPAAQLARLGLVRAPLLGLGPVAGAFASGAACALLMHPGSRAWLKTQGSRALHWARQLGESDSEPVVPPEIDDESERSYEGGVYVS